MSQAARVLRVARATLAACLPKAVRVDFGRWAIVRFFRAAAAAFLMFLRAADLCLSVAINKFSLQCRLKNCTARSWALAFSREGNVPRLRRLPVLLSFLRE